MQIKFSHDYPKLHRQKTAWLLKIDICDRSELSEVFVEYDTVYDGGHYPLPDGIYMVLLFQGNERIPFTTVRPWTTKKEQYYRDGVGEIFDIEIVREK